MCSGGFLKWLMKLFPAQNNVMWHRDNMLNDMCAKKYISVILYSNKVYRSIFQHLKYHSHYRWIISVYLCIWLLFCLWCKLLWQLESVRVLYQCQCDWLVRLRYSVCGVLLKDKGKHSTTSVLNATLPAAF